MVTTTGVAHATPAAFGSHVASRDDHGRIVDDYLARTRPNVLFGGGSDEIPTGLAANAGYTVVTDRAGLRDPEREAADPVCGLFGGEHLPYERDGLGRLPHLSEMVATALDVLCGNPEGFFLMAEGGRIDHAGHDNDVERNVLETIEFSNAVRVVSGWALGRSDTLVLVTADHETGGLEVLRNNGRGNLPDVSWSTDGHTGANVPVYALGRNASSVSGVMDNTDLVGTSTRRETDPGGSEAG